MLSSVAGMVTVAEAARRLSVSQSRVRQLVHQGDLPARWLGPRMLLAEEDVERRRAMGTRGGRRLTSPRAWGLLYLAVGMPASWLSPQARWRMRRLLSDRGLADLQPRLGERGKRHESRGHPSQLAALRQEPAVMLTGATAASDLRLGLAGVDTIDAYLDLAAYDDLVRRYHLQPSRDPNVILRVVPTFTSPWPPGPHAPTSAIALDLLEDQEPRARQVGAELMRSLAR